MQPGGGRGVYTITYENENKVDDFLIYIMESVGERPDINPWNKGFLVRFPIQPINDNPSLRFVLSHVKESERDYLTMNEIKDHSKFFTWLNNKSKKTSWREIPRIKE
ncbi:MAG: hypothetical protein ACE5FI_10700, partial [Anaerolineales bacterium]